MAEEGRRLPPGVAEKVKDLVKELETHEGHIHADRPGGEIELKINEDDALWYVAYKTATA